MMDWLLLAVCGVTLGISAYTFHKVRRIHLATYEIGERTAEIHRESSALYGQLVAWHELNRLLQFRHPMPPLRGWAASPDFLLVIAEDALQRKPEVIVECSSGSTTLTLARCCELNGKGHVFSLEHDPQYAEATRKRLHEQGLEGWASVIDAPLVTHQSIAGQLWYSVDRLILSKRIDLLIIDGPPWYTADLARYPALPLLLDRMAIGAHIYLDDAKRDEEKITIRKWQEEIPFLHFKFLACEKGCAVAEIPSEMEKC